jgi:hypothetical protein
LLRAISTIKGSFLDHQRRETTEIYLHVIGNSEKDQIGVLDVDFEKVPHRFPHA